MGELTAEDGTGRAGWFVDAAAPRCFTIMGIRWARKFFAKTGLYLYPVTLMEAFPKVADPVFDDPPRERTHDGSSAASETPKSKSRLCG